MSIAETILRGLLAVYCFVMAAGLAQTGINKNNTDPKLWVFIILTAVIGLLLALDVIDDRAGQRKRDRK